MRRNDTFEQNMENYDRAISNNADDAKTKPEMTILSALDNVVNRSRNSGLTDQFMSDCAAELAFLSEALGLTSMQVVVVGVLSEIGGSMSWRQLGQFLGITRLRAMSLTPDIDGLKVKRWVQSSVASEGGSHFEGFRLTPGVITALRKNQTFEPEELGGLSEQAFMDRLARFFRTDGRDCDLQLKDKIAWLNYLVECNPDLPVSRTLNYLNANTSRILLLVTIHDYLIYGDSPNAGVSRNQFEDWVDNEFELEEVLDELGSGDHELITRGLLEFKNADGMVDNSEWVLTSKAREDVLCGYKMRKRQSVTAPVRREDRDLRPCAEIKAKTLYYNPAERGQIDRIRDVISSEKFDDVRRRLTECGMRTGISCIFYGAPGTGKTETVLQLARETGRDILHVNIAGLRDKWVGESEKNIKRVFERYQRLCAANAVTPILLFNEADAIFGTRFERAASSVEKMDNAIQNIILQEMETFEGIMIATTNLTGNLDAAFDRRFLFKVEFEKPGMEAKTSIWQMMLPTFSADECASLAGSYDFSGGQIENIARKCKIEYVTTGVQPDLERLHAFCGQENLRRNSRHARVGF